MNMTGHCHVNTIVDLGLVVPEKLIDFWFSSPIDRLAPVTRSGRYRSTAATVVGNPGSFGIAPRKFSTAVCWAERIMPSTEKTRLEYQQAGESQNALSICVHEKDPMTAAANTVHYNPGISVRPSNF